MSSKETRSNDTTNLENISETNNTQRDIAINIATREGEGSKEFKELRVFSDYTSITKFPKLIKFLNKTPRTFQVRSVPSATYLH